MKKMLLMCAVVAGCRRAVIGVLSISLSLLVFGFDEDGLNAQGRPKQDSDVWGKDNSGAALEHGINCMCLGCQGVRSKEFVKECESRRRFAEEAELEEELSAKQAAQRRVVWDAQLRKMGVSRWSYNVETKYMSPRVKCKIVFSDGTRIDFNQKLKPSQHKPTPVEIVLLKRPELAAQLSSGDTGKAARQQSQQSERSSQALVRRPGWCSYCNARLISNKDTCCSKCKSRERKSANR